MRFPVGLEKMISLLSEEMVDVYDKVRGWGGRENDIGTS